jgi:hypothetical protein
VGDEIFLILYERIKPENVSRALRLGAADAQELCVVDGQKIRELMECAVDDSDGVLDVFPVAIGEFADCARGLLVL